MPIIHVEIVGDAHDYPQHLPQLIADTAGSVLNSRPGGTWVKVTFLEVSSYAENGGSVEGHPMIVSLVQAEPPIGDNLRQQVSDLADAIAGVANHPVENVHIVVEPGAKGRIAFGGTLVE